MSDDKPALNPPTFVWGQASPRTPIPVMIIGLDDDGVPVIPAGPLGVEPTLPDIDHTPTLNPPTFLWGAGTTSLMTASPVMLVGVDSEGMPYVVDPGRGVVDGSNAAPGMIGEYLVSSNTTGIQLTTLLPAAICQIELTPGDWDVWGTVDFLPDSNKSPNTICASISTHSDALPTDEDLYTGIGIMTMFWTPALTSGERQVLMTGQCRANITEPLTLYCVGQTAFSGGGTVLAKGYISARRVR